MCFIKLENVNLVYNIRKETKIKDLFLNRFRQESQSLEIEGKIHALKDINLTINSGDRLGIIGPNGAGKSSFLKLIAGIYPPTRGRLSVRGKIACLFELATGFEMEATGWDNIFLRGLMLGQTPKTIREKVREIAEFSELGKYLDIPVKYYSSGMFMRLAFSVSTAIEPEILLLDEVIAAGDAAFLVKANQRMKSLMGKVKILVFVTHSMDSLKNFCNTCIWMENGQMKMMGVPEQVSNSYISLISQS
ncbi:MAG: sugar ABC transporter [Firmicutes bacterium HGW-Firmicutes-14]|jgi:lipopolysaccharide transport system ATP-binding protein|nr:MAG: sugar ABC transporter [Firmicutes bacterium HGW-Firmicutes-14]